MHSECATEPVERPISGQRLHDIGDLAGAKERVERTLALGGLEHLLSMANNYLAKYEKDAERNGEGFNDVAHGYMVDALDRLACMDRKLKRAFFNNLVLNQAWFFIEII